MQYLVILQLKVFLLTIGLVSNVELLNDNLDRNEYQTIVIIPSNLTSTSSISFSLLVVALIQISKTN